MVRRGRRVPGAVRRVGPVASAESRLQAGAAGRPASVAARTGGQAQPAAAEEAPAGGQAAGRRQAGAEVPEVPAVPAVATPTAGGWAAFAVAAPAGDPEVASRSSSDRDQGAAIGPGRPAVAAEHVGPAALLRQHLYLKPRVQRRDW